MYVTAHVTRMQWLWTSPTACVPDYNAATWERNSFPQKYSDILHDCYVCSITFQSIPTETNGSPFDSINIAMAQVFLNVLLNFYLLKTLNVLCNIYFTFVFWRSLCITSLVLWTSESQFKSEWIMHSVIHIIWSFTGGCCNVNIRPGN